MKTTLKLYQISLALIAAVLAITAIAADVADNTNTVYVDQLDLRNTTAGWGATKAKKSVANQPIKINGKTYERGVGSHSPSNIVITLPPSNCVFSAEVGINDEVDGKNAEMEFLVYGDDKLLWRSGILSTADEPKKCEVKLENVKNLRLIQSSGPNNDLNNDHGDWADAKIVFDNPNKELLANVKTVNLRNAVLDDNGSIVAIDDEISREWISLKKELAKQLPDKVKNETYRPESLFYETDRDPLDVVLRRTKALLNHLRQLENAPNLKDEESKLNELESKSKQTKVEDAAARKTLFANATNLRRKISLQNPLLNFNEILFIKKHYLPEPERRGNHMCDQFYGFHALPDGGLFILKNAFAEDKSQQEVRNVLENATVEKGRLANTKLDKRWGFLSPDLSFDGKKIVFSAADTSAQPRNCYSWSTENSYHIFQVNADGTGLEQLSDGQWDDIDPCYLPSGRIAFISTRRGGYGRCHGRPVPSYTLHSMNYNGTDITMLSPHETNEWKPSVQNDGNIVYTRWDYVDRGSDQAHHPWVTTPDGRDSRAIQGNFPIHGQRDGTNGGGVYSRPYLEATIRAIPNSSKLIGIASPHHGQYFGSVILIDPTIEDDGVMSQIRRVTPEQLFPESEIQTHRNNANYGQPYPLSEDYYIVAYDPFSDMGKGQLNDYGIYLLDAFGNKTLIYKDPAISINCPIPFRARQMPPIIPHQTLVGKPLKPGEEFVPVDKDSLPKTAQVGVMNVYESIYPLPPNTKITKLRIVQVLPKTTPNENSPRIGYGSQKNARAILGTVPVEEDGSAFFNLPVDIPVYFLAIDQNGNSVQRMRSATYVKPGEKLMCNGCHENRHKPPIIKANYAKAMKRRPSEITPDMDGTKPFSYPRLIQPVLDAKCFSCHEKAFAEKKTTVRFDKTPTGKDKFFNSYVNLRKYVSYYDYPRVPLTEREAFTRPGVFGALDSKLWAILEKGHYDVKLTPEERERFQIWMDNNADFYGIYDYDGLEKQRCGEIVHPSIE
ncbi:MAG: NPCBM/NEW2 domain-containing protein [Planctomycetaceae bacterium]|nr:NPCBM/NEW2 domain-containing protein [Planctomycetaceae bacterium]